MNNSQATTDSPQHSLLANESLDEELGIPFSSDDNSSTDFTEALLVAQVYNDNDSSSDFTDALSPIENLPIESLPPPEENIEVGFNLS